MVWRKTKLREKNVRGTVKHGEGQFWFGAGFLSKEVGNFIFIDGNMERFKYVDVFKNV